jgi:hypothetical protein
MRLKPHPLRTQLNASKRQEDRQGKKTGRKEEEF